ncbi:MAG: hypothetical protein ACR2PK_13700 [Acidimicrobiales bacterium]
MIPLTVAHGVGSRGDLPLPLWQFVWAAIAAIVISFLALGALWKTPRLANSAQGRGLGWTRPVLRVLEPTARTLSFALFLLVVAAGLFGTDATNDNINPVAIYVVLWVVLQMLVPILGDVWKVLSPFDTIAIGLDRIRRATPVPAPSWSHWFAPVGAGLFIFMELIHPRGDAPRNLAIAMLLYTGVTMAGVWRWGRAWLSESEVFTVHFGLMSAMAPLDRDSSRQLRVRPPLSGLAAMTIVPVGTAVLLVVLGGVTFDGFGESELWRDLVGRHSGWENAWWRLAGLIAVTAVVAALYLGAIRSMANITGQDSRMLANVFAPSLVPIVFGYTVAHYLQLAVDESQSFVFRLSDPFGRGWDLFGGADATINFDIISVDLIAWCQALAVVVGHIAGVLVAHDRAVAVFDERDALRSQYVMLFVMVVYSVLGLWLLLNA